MSAPRALITGLAGFTGHYMARELEHAGYEVHGLGSGPSPLTNYHQADLADHAGLRAVIEAVQPTAVVHLAGIAFVGHGDAEAFYRVNLVGTRNLLAALAETAKKLDCILLASSANVYGNSADAVITEDTLPDPANDYAVSKLAMEYMARLWQDKLPIVIARPFNYTGVGQTENFLLPKIVSHFKRRAPQIELGNLDVWRDFSDVRAVAAAYRGLVQSKAVGRTFNVCSGQATSLREVIAMMEAIAGYRIDVQVNPAFVRANEVKTLTGSAERLQGVLGDWRGIPLSDTLGWMFLA
ncbi:GDP-mannose 4,6-dehydratase [Uliginosibacterium flavum]|uniref:GDP-mannose 4,6-dehydratase n=1 Tax=Uliginosibacterium flavum TaxID=1396831 RepID=A0ABV2TJL3_9RHOO